MLYKEIGNLKYMEPTASELARREICQFIVYVNIVLNCKTDKTIIKAASDTYGVGVKLEEVHHTLACLLDSLGERTLHAVFNPKLKKYKIIAKDLKFWYTNKNKMVVVPKPNSSSKKPAVNYTVGKLKDAFMTILIEELDVRANLECHHLGDYFDSVVKKVKDL